mgnify:CR=1 FL=1
MCGLYGWVGRVRDDFGLRHHLLAHRGPDEAGEFVDRVGAGDRAISVALGHRRLKIIDLSERAAQPMVSESGCAIAYNGEVYNYRDLRRELESTGHAFRSTSDTEVVLRAYERWGIDAIARFNGMFALAIWDPRQRSVLLARDPVGIKPLFYAALDAGLAFASEIKALAATPGVDLAVDAVALRDYFLLGYVPGTRTIYRGIRKVPPAHAVVWREGTLTVHRYWQPPEGSALAGAAEGELVEELAGLLARAVERQLVADVPLGAFLSGGVDSSLLVALMCRVARDRVKTFAIGFENLGLYDERPHAAHVARLFGTDHTEHVVRARPLEDLERILGAFDEPFADSSAVPAYYLAQVTRQHVTVAVSGTGGDDLFGGYRRYASSGLRRLMASLPRGVRAPLSGIVAKLPANRRSRLAQAVLFARRAVGASADDPGRWYADLMSVIDRGTLERLAPELARYPGHPLDEYLTGPGSPLSRFMRADFHSYLPDDLLVKEDRMSMCHGLEARVPFLDLEVVAFAWRLPDALKVQRGRTKVLLRRVAAQSLPPEVVRRPKHGFAAPVSEWLRADLRGVAEELLLGRGDDVLERAEVARLWRRHLQGEELGAQLWTLLVYRLWERRR